MTSGPTHFPERTRWAPSEEAESCRILIADDNIDAALSLEILLAGCGYEVHTVHNGADAFDAAQSFRPASAILDIGMPGLSGYEVAKRIRAQPWGTGMLLIAITGWGQPEDKREASAAGFDMHFTKPVDPQVLEMYLEERCRHSGPGS
jgi:two-component system CheB/CheR fusion protein